MNKERCECHDCTQARLTMLLKEGVPARSQYSGPMPMMPPPFRSAIPNSVNIPSRNKFKCNQNTMDMQQEQINRAIVDEYYKSILRHLR